VKGLLNLMAMKKKAVNSKPKKRKPTVRAKKLVTYNGETISLFLFCKDHEINRTSGRRWYAKGFTPQEMIKETKKYQKCKK